MRSFLLFVIAILLLGAGIYYQNDGQLPSLGLNSGKNEVATSTKEMASTTEPVSFIDRMLGFLHSDKKGFTITPDEIPEYEEETTTPDNETKPEATADTAPKPPVNIFTPSASNLSITEIKQQATDIANQLSDVQVDVETLVEKENASPYSEQVILKIGDTKTTDPDTEYLVLSAPTSNQTAVNITGWKIVGPTGHRSAVIPEGNRFLASEADRSKEPIMLFPGEQAYVITGKNPLKVAFRENLCTGYLAAEGNFTPGLGRYCPTPSDELLVYGGDYSDNEKCSNFVSTITQCGETNDQAMEDAEVPGGCEIFIKNVLTYQGCVTKHSNELGFTTNGAWRIYLERSGELWRSSNENIQLLDNADRLVDEIIY